MTRRSSWLLGVALLLGVVAGFATCGKDEPPTEILLTVTSTVDVDAVTLRVRNIAYEDDQIRKEMDGRSIVDEPLVVRLLPSSIIPVGTEFLVHARGILNGETVVAEAQLLTFRRNASQTEELIMRADFLDADADGFENCLRAGCDCNDLNPSVNPFTVEDCLDYVDNNCSGWPINESCPCNDENPWERVRDCTTLPPAVQDKAGIGACQFGTQRCVGGIWEESCTGAGTFSTEEIADNGIDDDCDGRVDEGSVCSPPNTTRTCFVGLIGSAAVAAAPPGSDCVVGTQLCDNTGHWADACVGETRPQRGPDGIGWGELPPAPPTDQLGQCDGRDNDCDGQVDEEVYFDGDLDGFTICGTNVRSGCTDPKDKSCLDFGVSAEFKDCDDSTSCRNPGRTEDCRAIWFNPTTRVCEPSANNGIRIDDDCRCDHGTNIGSPYVNLDGSTNCGDTFATLSCGNLPRSDANPIGVCSDTTPSASCAACSGGLTLPACRACTEPYHHGYFPAPGSATPATDLDCHLCAEQFGYACSETTGACTTKEEDCTTCDAPTPSGPADAERQRPYCTLAGPGCAGIDPPTWTAEVNADSNNECTGFSCTDYYCATGPGGSGLIDGQCFEKTFQSDDDVRCADRERCQTAADLCPLETECASSAVAPPRICVTANSGCIGQQDPNWTDQPNNSDIRSECPGSRPGNFDCNSDGAGAGSGTVTSCGPYFLRIEDDTTGDGQNNPWCFFRADVPDTFCSGRTDPGDGTACQTCAEGCSTSATRGSRVGTSAGAFYRSPCTRPTGGCDQLSGPTYSPILDGTDPYGDCGTTKDGLTDRVCNPNLTTTGGCYRDYGENCTNNNQCQPPSGQASGYCVDGKCCHQASCGECEACDVLGQEGLCWDHSRNNDPVTCDAQCSRCNNGACVNRGAGDYTECTTQCQNCLTSTGGNCQTVVGGPAGFNCDTANTFCCNGTCVDTSTAGGGDFASGCGSGNCANGTWGCSGSSARCSSWDNPCDYCSTDRQHDSVCRTDFGATCDTVTGVDCPACQGCTDAGTTTSCVPTGGTNTYPRYTDDVTRGLCNGNNTCNGSGACLLKNGQGCSFGTDCASGYCVEGVCCNTDCTANCYSCRAAKTGGAEGTCTPVTNNTDPDNDCVSCQVCNGAGLCVNVNAGQDPANDCTASGCTNTGFCNGGGACQVPAANTDPNGACTQCRACNGGGSCAPATAGTDPKNECTTAAAGTAGSCRAPDCNGAGACAYLGAGEQSQPACQRCNGTSYDPVNLTNNTQDNEGSNQCNATCQKCSSGSCISQTAAEDLFSHCSTAAPPGANSCRSNNCSGSGAFCGYLSGEQGQPTCNRCNGSSYNPVIVTNNTQDSEGSNVCSTTCVKCSGGTCINQPSTEDLFNHCTTAVAGSPGSCRSPNCEGTTPACGLLAAGERSQPSCMRCDGTSEDPIDFANNAQDTEGSNLCNSTCQKCWGGGCINQGASEDLFNHCSTATPPAANSCRSANCSGSGASCGFLAAGEQGQPSCRRCSGVNYDPVNVTNNTQDLEGGNLCDATCQKCSAGICGNQTSAEDLFNHCTTAAAPNPGSCRSPTCSGTGTTCGYLAAGEQGQPVCRRCSGGSYDPVNVTNNTQDSEGSNQCTTTCVKCSGGSCIDQLSTEDLFNQCTTASPGNPGSCRGANCIGTSAACSYLAAGEQSQLACKRCSGASYDPANIADNTQDTEGSNLCNTTCVKCSGGSCGNQASSEDLFNHCPVATCKTANCAGSSAACGNLASGAEGDEGGGAACAICYDCGGGAQAGTCIAITGDDAPTCTGATGCGDGSCTCSPAGTCQ